MAEAIHVLLVEDNPAYSAFIKDELTLAGGPFAITAVDSLRNAADHLRRGGFDVVLLDLNLDDSSGLDTLERVHALANGIPVVILSGVGDQDLAMAAVRAGAQDYLVKSEIEMAAVTRVVRYAIERRAAEARFHERDLRYRSIVESSFDAIISMGADGRVTEFNRAAEVMFGRSRTDVLGKEVADLIVPERLRAQHREGVARHLSDRAAPLGTRRVELVALRADGSEFPIELTLSKLTGVTAPLITAFIRDLSERRRAEEAMRVSEERFRLLSSATNDVIWDWNLETDQVWWNENFETVFGYRRDEVAPTAESWTSCIHPEDVARVTATVEQLLVDGGTRFWAEYRFRRRSGDYAFVLDRGQVIRNDAGKPVRMVGGMADMSERQLALTRIAEQASLLDQARDAILVRDLDHRVRYYNKSAERLYGWTAGDVMGQSVRERFFPDPAVFDETMQTLLREGDWQGEMTVTGRDGARLVVESRWTLTRDAAGEPRAVLVIDTDVTERKELERRFLRAQRMESIGTLAGGIAHDLNNMLAPVLMSIELLKEDPPEAERQEILNTIETSTRRGAEMVRQVLTFARGVEGDRQAVDVADLLKEVERFATDTFMKAITARTTVSGNVVVLGDATQLHQVLINLCVNARDAMPQGGTLTLSARAECIGAGDAGIDASVLPGEYVVIRVSDTGTGIPPGLVDRIFEPFFTSKPTGKGTGLGLSTSLAIVKSHGGFMRVESEVGRGSTFAVYLPALAEQRQAAPEERPHAGDRRGAGELILVVDDEAPVLRMTTLVLQSFGYRVLAAASGEDAVALFNAYKGKVKVLFTDMTMPGMDGATLIRKVREIDPATRVIAASGLGATEAARVPGVSRFLPKPYTADTILKAINDAVRSER